MSSLTEVIGWTLIHFVWQGSAIALVLAAALRILRTRSANARYLAACAHRQDWGQIDVGQVQLRVARPNLAMTYVTPVCTLADLTDR